MDVSFSDKGWNIFFRDASFLWKPATAESYAAGQACTRTPAESFACAVLPGDWVVSSAIATSILSARFNIDVTATRAVQVTKALKRWLYNDGLAPCSFARFTSCFFFRDVGECAVAVADAYRFDHNWIAASRAVATNSSCSRLRADVAFRIRLPQIKFEMPTVGYYLRNLPWKELLIHAAIEGLFEH